MIISLTTDHTLRLSTLVLSLGILTLGCNPRHGSRSVQARVRVLAPKRSYSQREPLHLAAVIAASDYGKSICEHDVSVSFYIVEHGKKQEMPSSSAVQPPRETGSDYANNDDVYHRVPFLIRRWYQVNYFESGSIEISCVAVLRHGLFRRSICRSEPLSITITRPPDTSMDAYEYLSARSNPLPGLDFVWRGSAETNGYDEARVFVERFPNSLYTPYILFNVEQLRSNYADRVSFFESLPSDFFALPQIYAFYLTDAVSQTDRQRVLEISRKKPPMNTELMDLWKAYFRVQPGGDRGRSLQPLER